MAMTKKEKAAFDALLLRAETIAALRWTGPVAFDVPAPGYVYGDTWMSEHKAPSIEAARKNAALTKYLRKIAKWSEGGWRDAIYAAVDRIEQLETALRLAADEPNIDKARAIADAALKEEAAE